MILLKVGVQLCRKLLQWFGKYSFVYLVSKALSKKHHLFRDEKIKNKILRIFKIWEQRGVYSEEFIADLCGLISVSPAARKNEEPHEFQVCTHNI